MLRRVALVRTDVSEEHSASIIRVTRIGELGTLAVTSNRRTLRRNTKRVEANVVPSSPILVTLMIEALCSSETSVLIRATRLTSQKTPFCYGFIPHPSFCPVCFRFQTQFKNNEF
jgi:hypothetical protein